MTVIGDTHGKLDEMYTHVRKWEQTNNAIIDLILQVGDFGAFPNPNRLDHATQKHHLRNDGKVDIEQFPRYLSGEKIAPTPTIFIKGNHEDFDFLEGKENTFIAENLYYLGNGSIVERNGVRIGGIGGNRSGSDKYFSAEKLHGWRRRHFTQADIERLHASAEQHGGLDILLTHDSVFRTDAPGKREAVGSPEITKCIEDLQPAYAFSGHYHAPFQKQIGNTFLYGLNHFGEEGFYKILAPTCTSF